MSKKEKQKVDKLTFDDIFEDFRKQYPRLSRSIIRWYAYNVGQIKIITIDNLELIYDYDEHQAVIKSDQY